MYLSLVWNNIITKIKYKFYSDCCQVWYKIIFCDALSLNTIKNQFIYHKTAFFTLNFLYNFEVNFSTKFLFK